jgi:hypothetical protein
VVHLPRLDPRPDPSHPHRLTSNTTTLTALVAVRRDPHIGPTVTRARIARNRAGVRNSLDSADTAGYSSGCSSAPTYAGHRDGLDRLRAIDDGDDAFGQH